MKNILLPLLFVFISVSLHAQSGTGMIVQNSAKLRIDTVSSPLFTTIPWDTNMVSYHVAVIKDGVTIYDKEITALGFPDNLNYALKALKPGSNVLYDDIKMRTPNGGTRRGQSRVFIIK